MLLTNEDIMAIHHLHPHLQASGPVPFLGALAALRWSRRLRKRCAMAASVHDWSRTSRWITVSVLEASGRRLPLPSVQRLTPLPAQLQLGAEALHSPGRAAPVVAQLIVDQPADLPGLEPGGQGEHQPGQQEPDRVVHQSGSGGLVFLQRLLCWC